MFKDPIADKPLSGFIVPLTVFLTFNMLSRLSIWTMPHHDVVEQQLNNKCLSSVKLFCKLRGLHPFNVWLLWWANVHNNRQGNGFATTETHRHSHAHMNTSLHCSVCQFVALFLPLFTAGIRTSGLVSSLQDLRLQLKFHRLSAQ